ncbi:ejaculatory bulb-specific protein 3 [Leptinotarsa decemlineata]|uniref:ejaculatory bulb-specific protein 3 n=1 Tax=Leptinotarsa decemlineata TaxID=7539 RepID=UPI000C2548FB|nr:ejaculatory bulb-specific protein 3-like [Leptinotarsa decemlineata]
MKSVSTLVLFCVLAVVAAQNGYNSKYNNVDVDKILKNDRVLTNYVKCLMEEGPCTPEGRELRKTLPDALKTGCDKCNPNQRSTAEKVMKYLMTKRAGDWERLTKKFDPQGLYKKRYQEQLEKAGKSA